MEKQITYRVWPLQHKVKYYTDLNSITSDFTAEQLKGSYISVILGAVVVGYLDTDQVINELLNF